MNNEKFIFSAVKNAYTSEPGLTLSGNWFDPQVEGWEEGLSNPTKGYP
ncbi:MAG: hypothetical protein QXU47_06960 [Candidatus Bathyarchaeia archaeon]